MKLRRTKLYLPGNNPNMLLRGHLFGPDGVILDLEDAVAPAQKDAARVLIREVLKRGRFGDCEVTIRINGMDTPEWKEDLQWTVPYGIHGIRIPKVEDPQAIRDIDEELSAIEEKAGIPQGKTLIFCLLETALGIHRAYDIAGASPRVAGICPGGEDLCADLHTSRSNEGTELVGPRQLVVLAANAAGVDALDTVFPRVTDDEGLRQETMFVKQLGFQGKSVIHPNQIPIIHHCFTPTEKEVESARRIVAAAREAEAKGAGAVKVDGKMVDKPVVQRARFTLQRAGIDEEVVEHA
ncbi:MAG: CoA ester lyase [Synergistales bacterium]|nr:CoA ester lyase [Synergistales bacterium]